MLSGYAGCSLVIRLNLGNRKAPLGLNLDSLYLKWLSTRIGQPNDDFGWELTLGEGE
jgi:hypothetical protein